MIYKMTETEERNGEIKLYGFYENDNLRGTFSATAIHNILRQEMQPQDTFEEWLGERRAYSYYDIE